MVSDAGVKTYFDFSGEYARIEEIIKMNKWGKNFDGIKFVLTLFREFYKSPPVPPKSLDIVDLCCGTGEDLNKFSQTLKVKSGIKRNFYGIDISSDMIDICKEKYGDENFNWINGDITNGLKTDVYPQLIYQLASFYLVSNPNEVVEAVKNFLEDNGLFIFEFYNRDAFINVDKDREEPPETLEYNGRKIWRTRKQQIVKNYLHATYTYDVDGKKFNVEHKDRLDSISEISEMLSSFKILGWYPGYLKRPLKADTDKYVTVIARKVDERLLHRRNDED